MRTYYGVYIYPINGWHAAGAKWEAYLDGPMLADTLQGLKDSIKRRLIDAGAIEVNGRLYQPEFMVAAIVNNHTIKVLRAQESEQA